MIILFLIHIHDIVAMNSDKSWENTRMQYEKVDNIWELFHENSKLSNYDQFPPDEVILNKMKEREESLDYRGYRKIDLPKTFKPIKISLDEAIANRKSSRNMESCYITLEDVSTILNYAYGITRNNKDTIFPRPFRTIPSAGALYPLEIYFYSRFIENQECGIYHYNSANNSLQLISAGDKSSILSESITERDIASRASLIIFVTALFNRSTFKYGDRGYRFALLEAGHLSQNIDLVANGLGLSCLNIGGFFDRKIDDLLSLDGINHSTIYITAIGKEQKQKSIEIDKDHTRGGN
jgi:SagB-type dehydrogenase family enzyme